MDSNVKELITKNINMTDFTMFDLKDYMLASLEDVIDWSVIDYNKHIQWTPEMWRVYGEKRCPDLISNVSLPMYFIDNHTMKDIVLVDSPLYHAWKRMPMFFKLLFRKHKTKDYGAFGLWHILFKLLSRF